MYGESLIIDFGVDSDNNHLIYDIASFPHLLIGGATQSGKSELIKSIILQCNAPVLLIDKKGVDYNNIIKLNNIISNRFYGCAGSDEASNLEIHQTLEYVYSEYEARRDKIAAAGCINIDEYNKKYAPNIIKKMLVIFDEYGEMPPATKNLLIKIVRLCRAAGIHFIISTQTPRASIIDGAIKANFIYKIALRTASTIESNLILGQSGTAELLPPSKGYFYFWDGVTKNIKGKPQLTLAQGYYYTPDEIKNIIENQ